MIKVREGWKMHETERVTLRSDEIDWLVLVLDLYFNTQDVSAKNYQMYETIRIKLLANRPK